MGAFMNKGLSMRSAQQHGERYIPMLRGYDLFKNKRDNCLRSVFAPNGFDGDGATG
jgi:hypothetical protein